MMMMNVDVIRGLDPRINPSERYDDGETRHGVDARDRPAHDGMMATSAVSR
jgi:hypothetical protein